MIALQSPLFRAGQVVATPGALAALEKTGQSVWTYLSRHLAGDWGEVDADDAAANDEAVKDGSRLLSVYSINDAEKTKIWIITEAVNDAGIREATTTLLPDEY